MVSEAATSNHHLLPEEMKREPGYPPSWFWPAAFLPLGIFAVVVHCWRTKHDRFVQARLFSAVNEVGMILSLFVALVLLSYLLFSYGVWRTGMNETRKNDSPVETTDDDS